MDKPSGWTETRIRDIAEVFDGPHATPPSAPGGPIFLGISSLREGRIDLSYSESISEDDFAIWTRRVTPQPGDVVFSYETRIGEAAIIPEGLRCCLGRRLALIRPNTDQVNPRFLLYAYLGPQFQEVIRRNTVHGATVDRILLKEFPDFPILLAPMAEQQAIADVLGALDDKIELNRKMNATLDELARTIFRSWFVDFDPVHAKAEGREPFGIDTGTAALFPDRFTNSELGPIPEGWKAQRVDEVAHINKSSIRARDEWETIRYIDISSTKAGDILETPLFQRGEEPSRARRRLSHGDTALSTVRPDRRSYFLALDPPNDLVASTGFAVVSPESVPWSFLHAALTQDTVFDALGQLADGGAYPAVRPGVVGELGVIVPEDARITDAYHAIAGPLFELATANREESRTLAELRDTLLPELISGRIRVPDAENAVAGAV